MTSFQRTVTAIACAAAIGGAMVVWHSYKKTSHQRKLVASANAARTQAERGDAKAESLLGHMYYHGDGVPQNYAEAFRWYGKAADQGDAKAEYAVGYMYRRGEGIPVNNAQALLWCKKAADQNEKEAQYVLGGMYYYGEGVPQDDAEAFRWYHKAADRGYAKAQYDLGYMYYSAKGVPRDYAEANRWFRKAAEQGDEKALRVFRMPFGTANKIFLSIEILGAILLLGRSLIGTEFNLRHASTLAGLIIFLVVGLDIFGMTHIEYLHSLSAINFLYFFKDLLAGMVIALLIAVVWPWEHSARITLKIACLLLFGLNALVFAHSKLRDLHAFYLVNGLLIGTLLPIAIFLWMAYKKSKDSLAERTDSLSH
jgi:hypothetical protein